MINSLEGLLGRQHTGGTVRSGDAAPIRVCATASHAHTATKVIKKVRDAA